MQHLLGKVLRKLIEQDSISSMLFWGPPGFTSLCAIPILMRWCTGWQGCWEEERILSM